jgi:hypothetical protein
MGGKYILASGGVGELLSSLHAKKFIIDNKNE